MSHPLSQSASIGPGGRLARVMAIAAPPLAWLTTLANTLFTSESFSGLSLPRSWFLLGIGAGSAALMAWLIRRMLVATPRTRDISLLLGLGALPWLIGVLSSLIAGGGGLTDIASAGFGGYASQFSRAALGAFLSWPLLGSAALGLTVAGFIRRPRPVAPADGALVAAAVLPAILFTLVTLSGVDLGPYSTAVIGNPVSALLILPFAGAATRKPHDEGAALPGLGAGFAFALGFAAAVSFAYFISVAQLAWAVSATASTGVEAVQAGLAEVGRIRLLPLWGLPFALLPAGAMAWQLARSGRKVESSLGFGVVLFVGVLVLLSARTQRTLRMLAGPPTGAATVDSTAGAADSLPSSGAATQIAPIGVPDTAGMAGVAGGVAGGVVGGVTEGALLDVPPVPISTVPPRYPDLARQAKVSGLVIVEVEVDSTGRVTKTTVLRGPALLAEAAVEAIRQWRYRPALRGGRPVSARKLETVNFAL